MNESICDSIFTIIKPLNVKHITLFPDLSSPDGLPNPQCCIFQYFFYSMVIESTVPVLPAHPQSLPPAELGL